MGTILKAVCPCGFVENKLRLGAGMLDHEYVCDVPALKNGSTKITMRNIKEKTQNSEYVFYNENVLTGYPNESSTIDFYPIKLHTENNFCPSCQSYNLQFIVVGIFD